MTMTWKRWVFLLAAAAVVAVACHFVARLYLFPLNQIGPPETGYFSLGGPGRKAWDEQTGEFVASFTRIPWPLWFGELKINRFDPNHPSTRDPQTIMGLALLGPEQNYAWQPLYQRDFEKERSEQQEWFDRLSPQAISLAQGEQRKTLERLAMLIRANRDLDFRSDREPAEQEPEIRGLLRQAKEIDPDNAYYDYYVQVPMLARRVVRNVPNPQDQSNPKTLPSESLVPYYKLSDPNKLMETARQIDEVLTGAETKALNSYARIGRELFWKATAYRYGGLYVLPYGSGLGDFYVMSSGLHRAICKWLCFMGDKLASQGQDELALRMYQHVYQFSQRLLNAQDRDLLNVLVGIATAALVEQHLTEFWAHRGQDRNVAQLWQFQSQVQRVIPEIIKTSSQERADPLGHNDAVFLPYARAAGVAWWLAVSGLAMFAASLLAAVLYAFRPKAPGIEEPPRVGGRALLALAAGPILLVLWLAACVPVQLTPWGKAISVVIWLYLLAIGWVLLGARVCMQKDRSDGDGGASSFNVLTLGLAAIVLLAAGLGFQGAGALALALGAGTFVLLGVLVWLIVAMVMYWSQSERQGRRVRSVKAFAVSSMLLAVVALLASLGMMGVTHNLQDRYYLANKAEADNELKVYLGEGWNPPVLSAEVFTLKEPSSQPASGPAGGR